MFKESDELVKTPGMGNDFINCAYMVLGKDTEEERLVRTNDYLKTRAYLEKCGLTKKFKYYLPCTYAMNRSGKLFYFSSQKEYLFSYEIYPDLANIQTVDQGLFPRL